MMNKYAIVTGVSSGIGECVANSLINEKGIYVFGIDINKPNNTKIDYFKCDIRNEINIIDVINKISNKTDHIDYLINVAGIFCNSERNLIENLSLDEWNNVIDVNLTGTFLVSKYAIPLLKKSCNGNIINLSSEQVISPQTKSAPYAISKAGIEMLSKILALELIEDKIEHIFDKANDYERIKEKLIGETFEYIPDKNMPFGIIKPYDVYKLVTYLLEEDNKITGQTILIDSGVLLDLNKKK